MTYKKEIVYVDDEILNLQLFKLNFEDRFKVHICKSPIEALELVKSNTNIEAIISDYKMPGMNGVSFINKVKDLFPDIPCYILTGFDLLPELQEAMHKGKVKECFSKPLQKEKIINCLA